MKAKTYDAACATSVSAQPDAGKFRCYMKTCSAWPTRSLTQVCPSHPDAAKFTKRYVYQGERPGADVSVWVESFPADEGKL